MAAWKLAPALAAGNCVVLKPAEQTPLGIAVLMEVIGDLLPPGVINVVHGFGKEAGQALATSKRIAKIAFTGSTPVGRHILQCAAENIIPSTVELGGKSPNIFFEDIMEAEPSFIEKAAEGLVLAFFNQGEVCTCPSRALVQEFIYPAFMAEVMKKVKAIKRGDPLDTDTMVGAQASQQQFDKILSYLDIARQEGAEVLSGGKLEPLEGGLAQGYYIQPTLLKGNNKMRVFQEEIFGPVVSIATFGRGRSRRHRQRHRVRPGRRGVPATSTALTASAARSRPAGCAPIATISTRRTRPSAATRSPASAAKPTSARWITISRPRICW